MARRKSYETPLSGRFALTLNQRQLKEIKKISIEFEMPEKEVVAKAVDVLIDKFNKLTVEELDEKGREALFGEIQ